MNTELLTCRRMTVGLVYPVYPLQPTQVNRLYADITERYPFQSLQHLPDGARMANPNGDFFVQTTRMQVNGDVDYFHSFKERAADLFRLSQERLQIPEFSTFGVKLTAFLPVPSGSTASAVLEKSMVASGADLDLLGTGRKGVGFRFVLHRDGIHEVKIEPFFSDLSQIYVEVDVQHPNPFKNLDDIEPRMEAVYNYLFGEIRDFLDALS